MLSRWPIRKKLLAGIALLLVILVTLFLSGIQGVYAYRGLAKSIRDRAGELPLATELAQHAGQLRMTLGRLQLVHDLSGSAAVGPPVGSDRLRSVAIGCGRSRAESVGNRWKPPGTAGKIPRPVAGDGRQPRAVTSGRMR